MTRTKHTLLPLLLGFAASAFSQYNYTQFPGTLRQISADTQVWGVNAGGYIYRKEGPTWVAIPGTLKQVTTSQNHVYGVNTAGTIFRYNVATNNWAVVPTTGGPTAAMQISVGKDGSLAAVGMGMVGAMPGTVVYLLDAGATTWRQLPGGGYKEVANGGPAGLWALHSATFAGTTTTTIYAYNRAANNWATLSTGPATNISAQGGFLMKLAGGVASRWTAGQWV
ncbi:MAG: hypothetical protein IT162_17165, partial [Bryobacterales bacterium]|nr:hypothetical protein [Bryobacterales bacterium]